MNPRILTTYEIVTPESAEQGDVAERGWVDEEGQACVGDDWDSETSDVDVAVKFLEGNGATANGFPFHKGLSYSQADARQDRAFFEKGEDYRETYHLEDFTPEQELEIYQHITGRK